MDCRDASAHSALEPVHDLALVALAGVALAHMRRMVAAATSRVLQATGRATMVSRLGSRWIWHAHVGCSSIQTVKKDPKDRLDGQRVNVVIAKPQPGFCPRPARRAARLPSSSLACLVDATSLRGTSTRGPSAAQRCHHGGRGTAGPAAGLIIHQTGLDPTRSVRLAPRSIPGMCERSF
jgi:hypothetical protein